MSGGKVRIMDLKNFLISKMVVVVYLDMEVGSLREMYWYFDVDEWSFFIRGRVRVMVFVVEGMVRMFDY